MERQSCHRPNFSRELEGEGGRRKKRRKRKSGRMGMVGAEEKAESNEVQTTNHSQHAFKPWCWSCSGLNLHVLYYVISSEGTVSLMDYSLNLSVHLAHLPCSLCSRSFC